MVAIAEYFIHKDTKNIKYVSIMVHGAPLAFLATYLLLDNKESIECLDIQVDADHNLDLIKLNDDEDLSELALKNLEIDNLIA